MNLLITNNTKEDLDFEDIFKKTIEEVLKVEKIDAENVEVSLSLVDKTTIHDLNKKYRNVDRETDVLSFPIEDFSKKEAFKLPVLMLGDIVLCVDKAKEQAYEYDHSLKREIMYLTCHSTLHLLGYDHIDENDKILMRKKEKEVMNNLEVYK